MEAKRAAFLVRCSTDKQDYERQLEDLRLVAERFCLDVADENIFGEHITGKDDTTKKDRLSIIKCREAAEAKRYDVLLVAEVSRMSRDSVSGRVYIRQFCNIGIPIYFRDRAKWTINPETMKEDESFVKELGSYFDGAAEYLKSMKTQIASGRRNSLRNNNLVVGHVLLGYKKRGGKERRHKSELIIDEETAPIVKDIYRMYLEEGATLKSVALAITAKYTRKTVAGIYQVLTRPEYYSGEYTIFMSDPDDKTKEPEPFTITFEPIIEKDEYDRVQQKLRENRTYAGPYPQQKVHPLTRLIKCASCGRSFSPRTRGGENGEKYRISNGKIAYCWFCSSRINNSSDCANHITLDNEKTQRLIWNLIKMELIPYADINKDEREEKVYYSKQRINEAEAQIELYKKEIERTSNVIKRAYKAYMNAPEDVQDEALKNYNDTLLSVKRTKEDASAEIARLGERIKHYNETIEYFMKSELTTEYIRSIEDKEDELRRFFLQLIEKIIPYSYDRAKIILEVYTVNGLYYILYDAMQKKNRLAHYISSRLAVWQDSTEFRLEEYEPGPYFLVTSGQRLMGINERITKVGYPEMKDVCAMHGWMFKF